MTAIISRMTCLWIWANFIATYFKPTKYTEFISLNAATLCGIECHPKIESIFAISTHSEERSEKIPSQLYLNGIVIASLSAASGTRWILTARRFKICSPKSHQDKPFSPINRNTHTRDKLTRPPSHNTLTSIYEISHRNWTTFGKWSFRKLIVILTLTQCYLVCLWLLLTLSLIWGHYVFHSIMWHRDSDGILASDNRWIKSNWISK